MTTVREAAGFPEARRLAGTRDGGVREQAPFKFVVLADGAPSNIRVIRSLDPGLDQQAILAAGQWRFEPGRLNGQPVDVLVTLLIDFWIR